MSMVNNKLWWVPVNCTIILVSLLAIPLACFTIVVRQNKSVSLAKLYVAKLSINFPSIFHTVECMQNFSHWPCHHQRRARCVVTFVSQTTLACYLALSWLTVWASTIIYIQYYTGLLVIDFWSLTSLAKHQQINWCLFCQERATPKWLSRQAIACNLNDRLFYSHKTCLLLVAVTGVVDPVGCEVCKVPVLTLFNLTFPIFYRYAWICWRVSALCLWC